MRNTWFENITLIVVLIAACLLGDALAGPMKLRNEGAIKANADAQVAGESHESTATFVGSMDEFKADRNTFLTRVTAFDTDMAAATNAIAATTGTTKTMGNKLQNEIDSLQQEVLMLKQMIVDLKKAMIADKRGK